MRTRSKVLVVVLLSGRPMIVTDPLETADAFVAAWLPGTEGAGVADVLTGDYPFTGKLPFTWPRTMDQLPFDFANLGTGDQGPLFPQLRPHGRQVGRIGWVHSKPVVGAGFPWLTKPALDGSSARRQAPRDAEKPAPTPRTDFEHTQIE